MSPKDEDFIRFYRDAVIAGHNEPAAETSVTSTSLAITLFGCLTRRSPDARVRTSATGSPENDHQWLLRARRQRPRRGAAEQRDERAAPHRLTPMRKITN